MVSNLNRMVGDSAANDDSGTLFAEDTTFALFGLGASISALFAAQESEHTGGFALFLGRLDQCLALVSHFAPATRLVEHDLDATTHRSVSSTTAGPTGLGLRVGSRRRRRCG